MRDSEDPLSPFRGRLLGLAYRMLGSRTEAEDVLQDAYVRIHGVKHIDNMEAFLVTTVTRLCLDRLAKARVRRDAYVGQWLPEPIVDGDGLSPLTSAELADDLSFALLLTLERLTPAERAAFLLRDVFEIGFSDIANILGKNEVACRKLASRGRAAVRARPLVAKAPMASQATLLTKMCMAVLHGDVPALMALLRDDAVLVSDGGGNRRAALRPIAGSERIARFLIGNYQKSDPSGGDADGKPCVINGMPGFLTYRAGVLESTLSIVPDGDRIASVYVVRNPEKLSHLANIGA